MVGLVQADGLDQLTKASTGRGDAGDAFPGTANTRGLTSTTTPSTKSYSGADTYVSITSISDPGPKMSMNITVKPVITGDFSPSTWYRLRNTFQGYALDVINDGRGSKDGLIQMAREGNFSGQFWQLKQRGDGTYAIRNLFLGAGKQLDVYGDDKKKPHLADAGNFSGQFWTIKPWGDGSFHFSNNYSGPELYLDTMEGGPKVALNSANIGRPTQRWTATPISSITQPGFDK
jgi:immune inhibitor A